MKVRIIYSNQHINFISAVHLRKIKTSELVPVPINGFPLTVFKSPVTSLIVNASIRVLTCPLILLNLNYTGAASKIATVPFITLT